MKLNALKFALAGGLYLAIVAVLVTLASLLGIPGFPPVHPDPHGHLWRVRVLRVGRGPAGRSDLGVCGRLLAPGPASRALQHAD